MIFPWQCFESKLPQLRCLRSSHALGEGEVQQDGGGRSGHAGHQRKHPSCREMKKREASTNKDIYDTTTTIKENLRKIVYARTESKET